MTETGVAGVLVVEPRIFSDARGTFFETYRVDAFAEMGIDATFVQDNVSVSRGGVLRGLHFQEPHRQAKLIQALEGEVFDVAVDVRAGSPTFGRAVWTTLSRANRRQLFIPPGFAHGFVATSDEAVVVYKCSDYYTPSCEHAVKWNDPALGIPWPVLSPVLSAKDEAAPLLADLPPGALPRFAP
ncbi:MAG: dTDP-4-dehydrorhamnose 3,5-epimerase [Gemmatimonadaceae bacterium]